MSNFGWSYPPGAANDPAAPFNQSDPPCECCGNAVDDCICPECPRCQEVGNPACYKDHGLSYNAEQLAGQASVQALVDAQAAVDQAEYEALLNPRDEEQP